MKIFKLFIMRKESLMKIFNLKIKLIILQDLFTFILSFMKTMGQKNSKIFIQAHS